MNDNETISKSHGVTLRRYQIKRMSEAPPFSKAKPVSEIGSIQIQGNTGPSGVLLEHTVQLTMLNVRL